MVLQARHDAAESSVDYSCDSESDSSVTLPGAKVVHFAMDRLDDVDDDWLQACESPAEAESPEQPGVSAVPLGEGKGSVPTLESCPNPAVEIPGQESNCLNGVDVEPLPDEESAAAEVSDGDRLCSRMPVAADLSLVYPEEKGALRLLTRIPSSPEDDDETRGALRLQTRIPSISHAEDACAAVSQNPKQDVKLLLEELFREKEEDMAADDDWSEVAVPMADVADRMEMRGMEIQDGIEFMRSLTFRENFTLAGEQLYQIL